jgi:hypothetical protein
MPNWAWIEYRRRYISGKIFSVMVGAVRQAALRVMAAAPTGLGRYAQLGAARISFPVS